MFINSPEHTRWDWRRDLDWWDHYQLQQLFDHCFPFESLLAVHSYQTSPYHSAAVDDSILFPLEALTMLVFPHNKQSKIWLTFTLGSGNAGKSSTGLSSPLLLLLLGLGAPTACDADVIRDCNPGGPPAAAVPRLMLSGAGDELSIRENKLAWATWEKFCGTVCCCCCCGGGWWWICEPTAVPSAGKSEGSRDVTCCCCSCCCCWKSGNDWPLNDPASDEELPLILFTAAWAKDCCPVREAVGAWFVPDPHNSPLLLWPRIRLVYKLTSSSQYQRTNTAYLRSCWHCL